MIDGVKIFEKITRWCVWMMWNSPSLLLTGCEIKERWDSSDTGVCALAHCASADSPGWGSAVTWQACYQVYSNTVLGHRNQQQGDLFQRLHFTESSSWEAAGLSDGPAVKRLLSRSSRLGGHDGYPNTGLSITASTVARHRGYPWCCITTICLPALLMPKKQIPAPQRTETNCWSLLFCFHYTPSLHCWPALSASISPPLCLCLSPKVQPVSHPAVSPGPLSGRQLCSLRS